MDLYFEGFLKLSFSLTDNKSNQIVLLKTIKKQVLSFFLQNWGVFTTVYTSLTVDLSTCELSTLTTKFVNRFTQFHISYSSTFHDSALFGRMLYLSYFQCHL